tara:strand:+ start:157578 stop:157814 length:237 start_codon:yes stop_codon:yes gene_type:complete
MRKWYQKYFDKPRSEIIDNKAQAMLTSIYDDGDRFTHVEQAKILTKLFVAFKGRKGDDLDGVMKEKDEINEALNLLKK